MLTKSLNIEYDKYHYYYIAGSLYYKDEFIRKLKIDEYQNYLTLSVFGNKLI